MLIQKMNGKRKEEIGFTAKCKYCEKSFFNDQILSLHMKSVHQLVKNVLKVKSHKIKFSAKCQHCEKSLFNDEILTLHVKSVHQGQTNNKTFRCDKCERNYSSKRILKIHVNLV